ncbi:MAG: AAA-like domain-containing protein [Clostridiales bacterium]|nr:AAA-like domain-containing protein [Clostridiales bacterium]
MILKTFQTTGKCIPSRHYMVNIDEKLAQIKIMVDHGSYFVMNRARQYGKTTTLSCLADILRKEYIVISLDFQKLSNAEFSDEKRFCVSFMKLFLRTVNNRNLLMNGLNPGVTKSLQESIETGILETLGQMFESLSLLCETAAKPIVLMIDEVDSASNNQIFLDFLAQLRGYYLDREQAATFHSVILAGVYDIKNLKLKIRPDAEHRFNSPWNIAETFDVDMSFSIHGIEGMLMDYASEHHADMDVFEIAKSIHEYTSGYPFLVSYICKTIDTILLSNKNLGFHPWSQRGIAEAVGIILRERSTLFDSFNHQLDEYPDMQSMLKNILFQGNRYSYNPYNDAINLGTMFGYMKNDSGSVAVSNRIFEMWLYNRFLSEDELKDTTYDEAQRSHDQFIRGGMLNMDLILHKFVSHFTDVYGQNDEEFLEKHGRKLFLLYLKPIINGTGHYYVEAETRDRERTDVIVDYLGQQFVIEMKIWRGAKYHAAGEQQLADYLEQYHLKKGYLLIFSFNQNKHVGIKEIMCNDKILVEATV